jgi:ClpX C4-type zinc finger protein
LIRAQEARLQDNSSLDLEHLLSATWGKLMMQDHVPAAALVALVGYVVAREKQDEQLRDGSLSILFKAVDELKAKHSGGSEQPAPVCSFCGLGKPEVRLAAGASGFICESCVAMLTEVFANEQDNQSGGA